MPPLSEWLELMLAEIARKRSEARQDAEEQGRRRVTEAPASVGTSASSAGAVDGSAEHTPRRADAISA